MKTVFTKEELDTQLKELKEKRKAIHGKRKDLLNNYSKKQQGSTTDSSKLHDLDLKIEDIERKIEILF